MVVEPRGILVNRVDHHKPSGNGLRRGEHSLQRVGQQSAPEALALQRSIERQPGEENRGDLAWTTASDRTWHLFALEKMGGQRVVADHDSVAAVPDERPRRSACRRVERVLEQPPVEHWLVAGEIGELVILAQLLDDEAQAVYRAVTSRARWAARVNAGFGRGSSSSAESRSSKNPAGTTVITSCSSSTSSARRSAAALTKSLVDSCAKFAACSIRSLDSRRILNSKR